MRTEFLFKKGNRGGTARVVLLVIHIIVDRKTF